MATKNSNIDTMEKNKEAIKKVSSKVHEELLSTSHLFIDETVATLTRMQKITGKAIKKSEPIIEKQIEMTFDAVETLKEQVEKGGKRALKLLGLTKQFNELALTIEEKINDMPTPEEVIENAKDLVASAKSDVEETITKASDSLKSFTNMGEVEVAKKTEKVVKRTISSSKTAKKVVKKAAKTVKANTKNIAAKTTKTPASKKPTAAKTTKATVSKAQKAVAKAATSAKSELTKIKGIGPSLAKIMTENGIKTIAELQNATPTALKVIAAKAGNRYKSFDTKKWIAAAKAIK